MKFRDWLFIAFCFLIVSPRAESVELELREMNGPVLTLHDTPCTLENVLAFAKSQDVSPTAYYEATYVANGRVYEACYIILLSEVFVMMKNGTVSTQGIPFHKFNVKRGTIRL